MTSDPRRSGPPAPNAGPGLCYEEPLVFELSRPGHLHAVLDVLAVLALLDALAVGVAAWRLGAGRARKEDPVQAAAGVELHYKPGAVVRGGEPLMTLHTDTPERFERALEALEGGFMIAPEGSRPDLPPIVIDRIA